MLTRSFPSFRVPADDNHGEQQYRIVGRNVEFSNDGAHWRRLAPEDVDLHLRLRTPLAPWLEAHLAPLRSLEVTSFTGTERRNVIWARR